MDTHQIHYGERLFLCKDYPAWCCRDQSLAALASTPFTMANEALTLTLHTYNHFSLQLCARECAQEAQGP
jgi:hypothetical protein